MISAAQIHRERTKQCGMKKDELVECLLIVEGDPVNLNMFDHEFRSTPGPVWHDRKSDGVPKYSFHGLAPVPKSIQRRGFDTAGKLWCKDHWGLEADLEQMQIKRRPHLRCYRFFTCGTPKKELIWHAVNRHSMLRVVHVIASRMDARMYEHHYADGRYSHTTLSHVLDRFVAIRAEAGFVV